MSLLACCGSGDTKDEPPSGSSLAVGGLPRAARIADSARCSLSYLLRFLCLGVLVSVSFELMQFLLPRRSWEFKLCLVSEVTCFVALIGCGGLFDKIERRVIRKLIADSRSSVLPLLLLACLLWRFIFVYDILYFNAGCTKISFLRLFCFIITESVVS